MSLYRLNASIRTDGSNSRQLADLVEQAWRTTHPADPIVIRDVGTDPIPATVWPDAAFAKLVPEDSRAAGQQQTPASCWPTSSTPRPSEPRKGNGSVINISSALAAKSRPGSAIYSATKAAPEALRERPTVCVSDRGGHGVGIRPSK